jgi:hypothetical protein
MAVSVGTADGNSRTRKRSRYRGVDDLLNCLTAALLAAMMGRRSYGVRLQPRLSWEGHFSLKALQWSGGQITRGLFTLLLERTTALDVSVFPLRSR